VLLASTTRTLVWRHVFKVDRMSGLLENSPSSLKGRYRSTNLRARRYVEYVHFDESEDGSILEGTSWWCCRHLYLVIDRHVSAALIGDLIRVISVLLACLLTELSWVVCGRHQTSDPRSVAEGTCYRRALPRPGSPDIGWAGRDSGRHREQGRTTGSTARPA
jgi:hypothetical protein